MKRVLYTFKDSKECVVIAFTTEEELKQADKYIAENYNGKIVKKKLLTLFWEDIMYELEENDLEVIEEKYMS